MPTLKEQIEDINYYQQSGVGHPLTCGFDSTHHNLEAYEAGGKVYLRCPDCDYIQTNIPKLPSRENIDSMKQTLNEWFRITTEEPKPEPIDTTQHRTITYDVTFNVTETLDFDPADWDEDMQTMDQYQAYQMEAKMDYPEELFELLYHKPYKISNVKEKNE